MNVKIVLFNGPPGSGKDTAANLAAKHYPEKSVLKVKFAKPVKEGCHGLFGLFDEERRVLPHDHYEKVKNTPSGDFLDMSPREAYIWYSEEVMKPKFGQDIFGKLALREIREEIMSRVYLHNIPAYRVFVSDSGFRKEAEVLQRFFGAKNVALVTVKRPGCTFEGDSRSYIDLPDSPNFVFKNDIEGEDWQRKTSTRLKLLLESFLGA